MVLRGKSAAPGVAVGRVFIHSNNYKIPAESFISAKEAQSHLDRYQAVKEQAIREYEKIFLSMKEHDPQKAEIFKAHQEIVDDVIINEEIPARILNEHWAGDWAIYQVYETVMNVLSKTADPLIAERASDFDDVRSLLLRLWFGETSGGKDLASLTEPCVIAAREFMPSDTTSMDKSKILAIITEKGGSTSHSAIIAKSYGIPAVMGIENLLEKIKQGQTAAVNADEGFVILNPEDRVAAEYAKKAEEFAQDKKDAAAFLDKEGRTACGEKIDIGLNIANADGDLEAARYADSVAVFRTEFLYMGRDTLPSEEEQYSVYRKVLECFGKRPVIIRTLDIGGDKKVSSIALPKEENPFLGVRALRLCFTRPDIFKTQIRALLRAAVHGNLWLMLPMVGSIEDIRRAKDFIASAKEELKKEGITFGEIKTGIMVEIPSIALIAPAAAKEADFASIGSNDLCQYLCAADRMNSEVEEYYQNYHPAILRLIKETVAAFDSAGKPVSICGELASEPKAVPLLVGLGLRKLGVNGASLAAVKRALASVTVKQCEELAAKALECATEEDILKCLMK